MNIIRKQGGSRVLAVSKVIPADWLIVEIEVIKVKNSTITIDIKKVR